jgi:ATP-binding cassette subfamily C (CFTR/MRP) protein 1
MLVPLAFVSVLYVKTMAIFRPAARDLKRAEAKARSPIYTHFGEALRGSETIRSIPGSDKMWSESHRSLTDINLGVFHSVKVLDRWLTARLETLGNIVVFSSAVASVLLTRSGKLKAGRAGWGLTQALSITGLLTWAVRTLTDLETNMMSVTRVKELTELEREEVDLEDLGRETAPMSKELSGPGEALRPLLSQDSLFNSTPASLDSQALITNGWPWRGSIKFKNVSMRYNAAAPFVLNGVNLTVPAGTTLGVVGRTGTLLPKTILHR